MKIALIGWAINIVIYLISRAIMIKKHGELSGERSLEMSIMAIFALVPYFLVLACVAGAIQFIIEKIKGEE